ncbi:hypothetical protein TOPH_04076 [Tolypocladium ophioglossoides CBS 100239]|uniref:Uncharacterized protein n=1 Tax=Tolypocladium ophioglossoides (strain CBS 100239) TaxID=1163406 RepID=A0A0L0NAW6_TOLOC|nr:hypothetical protein TOPH_04076 [Tolypocladium ophioglossoides CBS 100239]
MASKQVDGKSTARLEQDYGHPHAAAERSEDRVFACRSSSQPERSDGARHHAAIHAACASSAWTTVRGTINCDTQPMPPRSSNPHRRPANKLPSTFLQLFIFLSGSLSSGAAAVNAKDTTSRHHSNTMPQDFTYKSSGTNREGNHYCSRDYGDNVANPNSYHYSNTDGSWYYSNPNGSTYFNNGRGGSVYTSPSGYQYVSGFGDSRQGNGQGTAKGSNGSNDTPSNDTVGYFGRER